MLGILKLVKNSFIIFCASIIAFSSVELGLTYFFAQKAMAVSQEMQDPTLAIGKYGKSAKPLAAQAPIMLAKNGEVSKDARQEGLNQQPSNALEPAKNSQTKKSEDVLKRTENSQTFTDGKGGTSVEYSLHNKRYKEDGQIKDLGAKVVKDEVYVNNKKSKQNWLDGLWNEPQGFKSGDGPLKTSFQMLKTGEGIKISAKDKPGISMLPLGAANNVKPEVSRKGEVDYITYKNVWENVDLVYEYRGDVVKENIVVNKKPKNNKFSFKIDGGVTLAESKKIDGAIDVIKDGKPLYLIPPLTVSAKNKGPVGDSGAKFTINGDVVSVSLNWMWINQQKEDNYPIVIDPAVEPHYAWYETANNYTDYTAYKSDGYSCGMAQACWQNVGTLQDNGTKTWRSVVHVPIDASVGKELSHAQLNLYKITDGPAWYGLNTSARYWITWTPCLGYNCVPMDRPWMPITVDTEGHADITQLIQYMLANGGTGGWFILHGDDSTYKALDPYNTTIQLWYNSPPTMPNKIAPADKQVLHTTMPHLEASTSSDGDGDALTYQFNIYRGDTLVTTSGALPVPRWTVPDGMLEDGIEYRWIVAVDDGQYNGLKQSPSTSFTVDMRTGKDKTQTYDDVGSMSVNLADGNTYTSVNSHSIAALGGNIGLSLDYNTPSKSVNGLSAEYSNVSSGNPTLVLNRTDPNIDFEWGGQSPRPGVVTSDNFSVTWRGYFVAPQTGTYTFGDEVDDAFDFSIDANQDGSFSDVEQQLNNGITGKTWSSKTVSLQAGQTYEIRSTAKEYGGYVTARLYVRTPDNAEQIVPQDWFRSKTVQVNDQKGLMGKFYKDYDSSRQFKSGQAPFYVQKFNTVDTFWGNASPSPYDANNNFNDNFLARFNGYITIPVTGSYRFDVFSDDGQRMYLNGNKILENWTDHGGVDAWSSPVTLNAGQVLPISVEYYDHGGGAEVHLKWDGPAGSGVIPADYLSTSYKSLPTGWNLSLDVDGNLAYEKLKVLSNGNVDLSSGDGTIHTYTFSSGGFKPPVNEAGNLVINDDGSYTLTDTDGRVYQFSNDGTLRNVSTPPDDLKPAALKYEYQEQTGVPRLKKIIDGVDSTRFGELFYGGDSACQQPTGYSAAPAGYLCAFKTSDGQETHFFYLGNNLARVQQPGSQLTDFGTDSYGRISSIRDVLANDAIATNQRTDDENVLTQITYDALGRLTKVKQPAAKTGDTRIEHTLEYGYGKSKRHITGADEPNGYLQYLEYDALQRTTKLCDIAALCAQSEWDSVKDLLLSSTDATGLKSTTIYDDEDRSIETYGAAPSTWFGSDRKPLATYASQVPKTSTAYDEGMTGLAAAYYTSNAPQQADVLSNGQYLFKGQSLWSMDRRFQLAYQPDGNLVLYGPNGVMWYTATYNMPSDFLVMQGDGNMVMYGNGAPVWSSNTNGGPSSFLAVQNDGNMVIYASGAPRWASNTGGFAASTAPANVTLTGVPQLHSTNIATDGTISKNYGTASPIPGQNGSWGLRLTGRMRLPQTGNWTFRIMSDSGVRVWIDDNMVLEDWKNDIQHSHPTFTFNNTAAGSSHRVRIDYYHPASANGAFNLYMTPPGSGETQQVAQYFSPDYSLATTQTTYDSTIGNRTVKTNYGNKPEYGQAQSTTVDPTGLNLTSSATYETPGSGYLRQTTRSLPGNTTNNPASSYEYYNATETADNPCTTEVEAYKQAGFIKKRIEADPDGNPNTTNQPGINAPITSQTIYDTAGRQVATRKNQDAWTCTSYDARGRAIQTVSPTVNGRVGRTVTTNYSYQGSPLKTQVTDSVSGSTVVETDLLGKQIASTDTFGNAYTVTYDNFGKVLTKTSPLGTEGYTYDNLNRVTEQKIDNVVYAALTYDQYSRVTTVTYPQAKDVANNKLTLEQIKRDNLQRDSGAVYRFTNGQAFDETVTRSVSGIVTGFSDTFAGQTAGGLYQYDNAGRLIGATIDQNQYAYSYAAPTACSGTYNANANKNSNRTTTTVNGATTSNCYNFADQLVASTDAQVGTPTYDDHGNTVTLAGNGMPIAFTYNSTDQNTAIAQNGNKVEYVKSASGSVLRKKEYENNTLVRSYRFVADGKVMQSCSLTDDNACSTTDKYISLAGNVLLTLTTNQTQVTPVYSVKNFHGDTAMTAGANGTPTSSVFLYEPFGQASQSATFGTGSNPANATGGTMGWAANPTRKQEQLFTIPITQMGARVYLPTQGRFLQTDPVEGGTPNAYVYTFDPVNGEDYSGQFVFAIPLIQLLVYVAAAALASVVATTIIRSDPFKAAVQGIAEQFGGAIRSAAKSASSAVSNLVNQGFKATPNVNPRPPRRGCEPKPQSGMPPIQTGSKVGYQQKVLEAVRKDLDAGNIVGERFMTSDKIGDPRYSGFSKFKAKFTGSDGVRFEVHYMYNEDTCEYGQIKIKTNN